ncbi:MAG: FAD:protein FMN transferase [Planctomycetia bacterium]|nr:FAD:protein FMN transferase [Planctomycetia bacterium]
MTTWLTLLAAAAIFAPPPCAAPPDCGATAAALQRFEFSQVEMGMPFTLILYAPDEAAANAASSAAFDRLKELNAVFSDFSDDSELAKLSATAGSGKAVKVSRSLWDVLIKAQSVSEQSEGAFDATVGPLVTLWRRSRREKKLPSEEALQKAKAAVGHQNLVLDPKDRTATLKREGMRLDLGGIAVGYALDDVLALLKKRGITRAIIDGSGDVLAGDPPPGKEGWRVGIAPLDAKAPPSRFVVLKNAALSTSGDAFQHVVIDGRRYAHIVDPKTGVGLPERFSVTVAAPDAVTADSLATAVCVLGPEKGIELIEKTAGCAVFIVRNVDGTIETHHSRRWTELTIEEAKPAARE